MRKLAGVIAIMLTSSAAMADLLDQDFRKLASDDVVNLSVDDMGIRRPEQKSFLICGPENLKNSITTQLQQEGVAREHIYDEEFAFR